MCYRVLLAIVTITIALGSEAITDQERSVLQQQAVTGSICTFQLICIKSLMTAMGRNQTYYDQRITSRSLAIHAMAKLPYDVSLRSWQY